MEVGRSIFKAIADFSGIRREANRTAADLDRMKSSTEKSGSGAGAGFAKGFGRGLGKLLMFAPLIGALGAAGLAGTASLLSLASSMTVLTGAGAPLIGMLAAVKVASGVLGIALKDAKKYVGDLQPAWDAMKQSVSSNFWYFASKPIHELAAKGLPILRDGLENIGSSWGKVAAEAATAAKGMVGDGRLKQFLESTRVAVLGLKPAVKPALDMLLTLGAFGARQLPYLTAGISKMAGAANTWVQNAEKSGKLQGMWDSALKGIKDLVSIAKSALGIVGALMKAAQLSGANSTLTGLATGLKKISDLMNAPGFQTAMSTIFAGANKGADGLMKALAPIGDMFQKIAPALGLFLQLGGEIVGTVLTELAKALSNPLLMAGLDALMGGLLIAVKEIGPALGPLAGALGVLFASLAPVLVELAPVITGAALAAAALITALSPFLPVLVPIAAAIGGIVAGFKAWGAIQGVIDGIKGATAVQWLWNAALDANPIGLIIIAIAALVAGLIWFFTQTDMGRQIWGGFMNWLGQVIGGFLNWWNGTFVPAMAVGWAILGQMVQTFLTIWSTIWNAIWSVLMTIGQIIWAYIQFWVTSLMTVLSVLGTLGTMAWNWFMGIWNSAVAVFGMIMGFIGSIPGTIIGWLSQLAALGALAWGWFMGMVNAALGAGGQLLAYIGSIPGQVLGFLGNLGGLLVGAGQSLIQGFIDGVSSMIGAVGAAVGGVMDFIGGFFPHSPAKRGEFSGRGWTPYRGKALMTGFADGIAAGQQSGVTAAGDATLAISNQLNPTISPLNALGGAPASAAAPALASAVPGKLNPNAGAGGGKGLSVTVVNPAPEPPSRSIQKTYNRIAYLGLDAKETVGV